MSIQYVPGWWDQIKPEATGFMSELMKVAQPDFHANKKLQEMMMQNPGLADQIANMSDDQRQMFAQTMGFKKQQPFANMAPGAEREKRERNNATINALTPDEKRNWSLGQVGAKSQADLDFDKSNKGNTLKLFDVNFDKAILDKKTGELNLKNLTTELDRREKILARHPSGDIAALARRVAYKQPVPTEVLERVMADQNIKSAYDDYLRGFQMEIAGNLQGALARIRNPGEKLLLLPTIDKSLDDTQRLIQELEDKTTGKTGMLEAQVFNSITGKMIENPVFAENKKALTKAYNYRNELEANRRTIMIQNGLKVGEDIPKGSKEVTGFNASSSTPPPGPSTQNARVAAMIKMIEEGKGTVQQLQMNPKISEADKAAVIAGIRNKK